MEGEKTGKGNNKWIWIVAIIVVLLVLLFAFKGDKAEKTGGEAPETGDIDSIDIGDNPDINVDDVNSLPASQEPVSS